MEGEKFKFKDYWNLKHYIALKEWMEIKGCFVSFFRRGQSSLNMFKTQCWAGLLPAQYTRQMFELTIRYNMIQTECGRIWL